MNSLQHNRNKHRPLNADQFDSGLIYRFTPHSKPHTKERTLSPNSLKPSQSLPTLQSPPEDNSTTSLSNKHPPFSSSRTTDNTAPPPPPSSNETRRVQATPPDHITIRVIDDPHGVTKNFICPASLLLSSMTYFRDNLSNYQDSWQDIDISVHCDLQVFSWLMEYIMSVHSPSSSSKPPPKLDAKRVFSVLVSSEYLGMSELVDTCIQFISENINAVLAVHSSAECLNQSAVDKLANLLPPDQIETMEDPNNLLQNRLFSSKLRTLVSSLSSEDSRPFSLDSIYRCSDCQHLVVSGLEPMFLCTSSSTQIRISPHGSLYFMHRRDSSWSVSSGLEELSRRGVSERDRFWRGWGYCHLLFCSACKYVFMACDMDRCCHLANGVCGKMKNSQSSNFMLLPPLLSPAPLSHVVGQGEESVAEFEEKLRERISEMASKTTQAAELSVWSRTVFDSSVHQLSQFKHLYTNASTQQFPQDTSLPKSLKELQLFSHTCMSTSLTLSQFYRLKEETPLQPPDALKQRPLTRVSSRDRSQRLRPFAGSVSGENEIGTEGDDDEKSDADTKSAVSSISKSRSLSSQYSLSSLDTKSHTPTWNPLRSRKNNIDLQRETEYVRSVKMSRCLQNLASHHLDNKSSHHPVNGSICDRIEKSFKASLTSRKLQRYQQTTDPKLKKKYAGKQ